LNFILGTATFGGTYGIANQNKNLTDRESTEILKVAQQLEIYTLDTAPLYGNSESIIGAFHDSGRPFLVNSKVSEVHDFESTKIIRDLRESTNRIGISQFSTVYFHRPEQFTEYPKEQVNETLEKILDSGLTGSLGASVYTEVEVRYISENFPKITHFQVPENIMDRRLVSSQLVKDLYRIGYNFCARSIFLQGLLLMGSIQGGEKLAGTRAGLGELENYCISKNISVLDACINYASTIEWCSGIVIGAASVDQLKQIVNYRKSNIDMELLPKPFDIEVLDPRRWVLK
jgi:aryl-alcohol dehydrogenase-like predicted oxidoreductase